MRLNMNIALGKAEESKLSEDELKEVIYRLESLVDKPNVEILLNILGEARRFEYKHVMEKFLYYFENPQIPAVTLSILVEQWGMGKQYSSYIKEMIKAEDNEDNGYVRSIAISNGSYYFHEIRDEEILSVLLESYEETNDSQAYKGILTCLGLYPEEISSFDIHAKHLAWINPDILKKAYQLLKNKD